MAAPPTPHLGIVKPEFDQSADIRVVNTALDQIDAAFGTTPGDLTIGEDLTVLGTTSLVGALGSQVGLSVTANAPGAAPPAGSVYRTAVDGLTVRGAIGSTNDLTLLNNAGAPVLRNPTGTDDVVFADDVTILGDLTVTGTLTPTAAGDLIARSASVTQALLGAVGGNAGVNFGNPGDTNLYRSAANILKTDDALVVALGASILAGGLLNTVAAAGTTAYVQSVTGDAQGRLLVTGDGTLNWGNGSGAQDINLYRAAAGALKTDGSLEVASVVILRNRLGFAANGVGIAGSIYRDAVGGLVLWGVTGSTSELTLLNQAGNSVLAVGAGTQRVTVFDQVLFGAAGDTNLFRGAADRLQTDDGFLVGQTLYVGQTDTDLYRSSASILRTTGSFSASGTLSAGTNGSSFAGTQIGGSGLIVSGGTLALVPGKTVTLKSAATIPLNGSAGAYATIYTVPANSYGTLHVSSTAAAGPSRTYQQLLWVSDGSTMFLQVNALGAAISGASGSNLTFASTGLNIQARGVAAATPDGCKVWAEYAAIATGG